MPDWEDVDDNDEGPDEPQEVLWDYDWELGDDDNDDVG